MEKIDEQDSNFYLRMELGIFVFFEAVVGGLRHLMIDATRAYRPFVDQCQGSLGKFLKPYFEAFRFNHR